MISDRSQFELHNVAGNEPAPGINGQMLVRLPPEVRLLLNERARFVAMESTAAEVRFVTDAPTVKVHLSCLKPEFSDVVEIKIFRGNFEYQTHRLAPGVLTTITLTPPPALEKVRPEALRRRGFAPDVWRVVCGRGTVIFSGLDTFGHAVRPPRPEEKPALTWLAYGSSITHSSLEGYPLVASRRLGVDVINLGMSGACQAEPEVADWIAARDDWDFATLELGINMLGSHTPEAFRSRAEYLLRTLLARHPAKPLVIITLFPFHEREGIVRDNPGEPALGTVRDREYRRILHELHREIAHPHLHLVEGEQILDDFNGCSADLLHPCIFGHAVMGLNLAEILRPLLPRK